VEKAPNWKSARVTQADIANFKMNRKLSDWKLIGNDKKATDTLVKALTANKELQAFTKMNHIELKKIYKDSFISGQSFGNDVYQSSFETANITVVTSYDLKRDLLLDAYIIDHTDVNNVKITSRNIGEIISAPVSDLVKIKNGDKVTVRKYQEKYQKKLIKSDTVAEKVAQAFTINTASAATDGCGNGLYGQKTCSWVSVAYCAAAGLLGFWPGLICSVTATLVCDTCKPGW